MVSHCPRCGKKLADDANYCLYCGKPIRVAERTGLPTAGGVLAIIAACISIVKGIFFLWAYISAIGYHYYSETFYIFFALIGVFGVIAFASGLAAGILALKRQKFGSTLAMILVMLLSGAASAFASFYGDYYTALWIFTFIFEAPAMILSVLGAIFIGTKKEEFLLTVQPTPMLPSLSTPSRRQLSVRCPNCGRNNPSNFKFCGKCGNPLGQEETEIY